MDIDKRRLRQGLAILGLAAVIGWSGLQGAVRFADAQSNPYYGMGGMMGSAMGAGMSSMMGYGTSQTRPDVDEDAPRVRANVSLTEWKLTPTQLEGSDGQMLEVTVKNDGAIVHGFVVPGLGVDVPTIAPGRSTTVKIPLKTGKFEMYCPIPGHKQLGQVGTIVVE